MPPPETPESLRKQIIHEVKEMECNICGENVEGIATGLITIEVKPDGYVNVDDEVGGAMHDKCYANLERSARVAPELLKALENAYADINWLLVEGFDTNAEDCTIPGVQDTIAEIRQAIANVKRKE